MDKEWLEHEYYVLGKTQKQIAQENGIGTSTICRWMKEHNIDIRPVSEVSSKNKKKFWSDEQNKEKYLLGNKNPTKRPDVRKKLSKIIKEHWDNDEERKLKLSERSKKLWTDDRKNIQSLRMKERNETNWEKPEYQEKMSEISLRTWNDPKYIIAAEKIAATLRKNSNSSEFRERASDRAREAAWKRLERNGVNFPSYNPSSISIIENYAIEIGEFVQHAENGGEFRIANYWLDGYISSKNIAIEYDEPGHFKKNGELLDKDIKRMKRIHKEIKCTFIRIKYNGLITVYDEQWFMSEEQHGSIK